MIDMRTPNGIADSDGGVADHLVMGKHSVYRAYICPLSDE